MVQDERTQPALTCEEQADLRRLLDTLTHLVGWPVVADPLDRLWIPLRPLGVESRGYRLHRGNLPNAARPGAPLGHIVVEMSHLLGWGPGLEAYLIPVTLNPPEPGAGHEPAS
jgi:hypothetical protein